MSYRIGYISPERVAASQPKLPDPNASYSFGGLPVSEPQFVITDSTGYSSDVASDPYEVSDTYKELLNQLGR